MKLCNSLIDVDVDDGGDIDSKEGGSMHSYGIDVKSCFNLVEIKIG